MSKGIKTHHFLISSLLKARTVAPPPICTSLRMYVSTCFSSSPSLNTTPKKYRLVVPSHTLNAQGVADFFPSKPDSFRLVHAPGCITNFLLKGSVSAGAVLQK